MRRFIHDNGLSLAAALLFAVSMVGQAVAGLGAYNVEQRDHGGRTVAMAEYLTTGHFLEATFENWESEFLQMATFIFLTAFLVQKGSAESNKPAGEEGAGEEERLEDPRARKDDPDAPWPVRRGGIALALYRNSLSAVLFLLFVVSFLGHAAAGAAEFSAEAAEHGGEAVTMGGYLAEPRFWFESFQNWQSEFLSVLAIVLLSIVLRQHRSPESKPVHAPNSQTGGGG